RGTGAHALKSIRDRLEEDVEPNSFEVFDQNQRISRVALDLSDADPSGAELLHPMAQVVEAVHAKPEVRGRAPEGLSLDEDEQAASAPKKAAVAREDELVERPLPEGVGLPGWQVQVVQR